jgi:hypothetical protein
MLAQLNLESARLDLDLDLTAWKGIVDGTFEGFGVAELVDRLQGRGQVGAIIAENGREGSNLRNARR